MGAACQSTYWPANEAVAAADEDGANPGSSEVVEAPGLNGRVVAQSECGGGSNNANSAASGAWKSAIHSSR